MKNQNWDFFGFDVSILRVKGSRYGKSNDDIFCRERTEDSENQIRFSIASTVLEI